MVLSPEKTVTTMMIKFVTYNFITRFGIFKKLLVGADFSSENVNSFSIMICSSYVVVFFAELFKALLILSLIPIITVVLTSLYAHIQLIKAARCQKHVQLASVYQTL